MSNNEATNVSVEENAHSPDNSPSTLTMKREHSFDFHSAAMENVFIGISGLIGAGKSTLATALAKRLGLPVYYEPVIQNAYLEDFYKDMKKYSFPLQVYLLNQRFKQQQCIIWQGKGGVQDRTIYEDSIFAKMLADSGLMESRDYETYLQLFDHMSNFMKKPNMIVHLDVTPEESLERIKMRNRSMESNISLDYLRSLHKAYEDFITHISRLIPVIRVNYSKFRTADEMAQVVAREYSKMCNVRVVDFPDTNSPKKAILATPESPRDAAATGSDAKMHTPMSARTADSPAKST